MRSRNLSLIMMAALGTAAAACGSNSSAPFGPTTNESGVALSQGATMRAQDETSGPILSPELIPSRPTSGPTPDPDLRRLTPRQTDVRPQPSPSPTSGARALAGPAPAPYPAPSRRLTPAQPEVRPQPRPTPGPTDSVRSQDSALPPGASPELIPTEPAPAPNPVPSRRIAPPQIDTRPQPSPTPGPTDTRPQQKG
jgi:hypothetical protein